MSTLMQAWQCPNCGSQESGVVDSRQEAGRRRRRRVCSVCNHRWTTVEVHEGVAKRLEAMTDAFAALEKAVADMRSTLDAIDRPL